MFNINEFRNAIQFEGARPNQFYVQIDTKSPAANIKLPFLVQAASIPPSALGTIPVPIMGGRQIKMAGDRTFESWSVNVYNDEDFMIRDALEAWSNSINKLESNVRSNSNYKSDAIITQLNKEGLPIKQYKLVGLWPSNVGQIELNWGDNDSIETFQCEFQYDYYVPYGVSANLAV